MFDAVVPNGERLASDGSTCWAKFQFFLHQEIVNRTLDLVTGQDLGSGEYTEEFLENEDGVVHVCVLT